MVLLCRAFVDRRKDEVLIRKIANYVFSICLPALFDTAVGEMHYGFQSIGDSNYTSLVNMITFVSADLVAIINSA